MSTRFIGDFKMACSDDDKAKLQDHMGHVHVAVTKACREYFERSGETCTSRQSRTSPSSTATARCTKKLADVQLLANNINAGLSKMFEAKKEVNEMKVTLAASNKLAQAQADAAVLLKQISADTAVAEKEKEKVNVVVEEAVGVANVIAGKEAEVANDLALAKPRRTKPPRRCRASRRRT